MCPKIHDKHGTKWLCIVLVKVKVAFISNSKIYGGVMEAMAGRALNKCISENL